MWAEKRRRKRTGIEKGKAPKEAHRHRKEEKRGKGAQAQEGLGSAMEECRLHKVVITGATGMIGLALIGKCLREKTEVLAFVRERSGRKGRIPAHPLVRVIECGAP